MERITLVAEIHLRGINPYVSISQEQAQRIKSDWRRPMPVLVDINGLSQSWSTNMMPTGDGDFLLYLHGEMRASSHTAVGDIVHLTIGFNAAYQNGPLHEMPHWFQDALEKSPLAQSNWTALSPSRQKEVLRYLAALKSTAAKGRNVARILEVLSGRDGRFMGRNWRNGA